MVEEDDDDDEGGDDDNDEAIPLDWMCEGKEYAVDKMHFL